MPSPFPGMDPYLEGSEWGMFHVELSVEIRRQLSPKVRPKYHVLTMRRFITDVPEAVIVARRDVYPGAAVVKESPAVWQDDVSAPIQIATVMPTEIPHYVVEILTAESRELVTTIEVLSPANKRGQGYADYLEKRALILRSDAHLIEVDLLRQDGWPVIVFLRAKDLLYGRAGLHAVVVTNLDGEKVVCLDSALDYELELNLPSLLRAWVALGYQGLVVWV